MVKIIGIFNQDTSPVAFLSFINGKLSVEAVNEDGAKKVNSVLDEIMDISNGTLMARTEVVEPNGEIIVGSRPVKSTDPDYLDVLSETIHSAGGLLTVSVFAEAKQLLVNLSKSGLSQDQKDKIFASIINMSEEDIAEVVKAHKEIVEMGEELKKIDTDWEEMATKIKTKK